MKYTTQMNAARQGIVTKEMEAVAAYEGIDVKDLMAEATKSGSIVIETASVKTMTSETICAFTAASMEDIFKHISENIICISCKMILLISSRTTFESLETISKSTALIAASCRLVKCGVSKLVIHLLLFRITQY